jgi:DNA-binding NarL/FixJ family response regulator
MADAHTMNGSVGYVVALLEDRAGLWPSVERLLPAQARGDGEDLPAPGASDCAIGLVGWTAATHEEIAGISGLRERHPGPIVAVLGELPGALGARAIAERLEGTVLATEMNRVLLPTLNAVTVGQCVVPHSVRQIVDRPPLSPRERQILAMVVLDFSNAEIARKLFVTESNVKNHLSSAFQKLGVKSRSAATELILDRESGLGPGILRISPEEALPELG